MRVTAPSHQHGGRPLTLTRAALTLLAAGMLWLVLRGVVAWITLD